jgi:RHS repeat-associated protein
MVGSGTDGESRAKVGRLEGLGARIDRAGQGRHRDTDQRGQNCCAPVERVAQRRPSSLIALTVALVLALAIGAVSDAISLPGVGAPHAGAAVTPPVTGTGQDGRVPSASSTGGLHGHIEETGGCLSWGANYVAATYAHPSTTTYGVWAVNASGGVFAERGTNSRTLPFHNSLNSINRCPTFPVMGIARTRSSGGYWIATAGGGVFATRTKMGSTFRGSRGTGAFTGPMTAIVSDPTGTGYWLVDVMGQVYAYGTGVGAYGNAPGTLAGKHAFDGDSVVAMAATPTGGGYWMLTNYGTVFAIGAPAQAAMSSFTDPGPGSDPADLYVGITPGPGGQGFWLVRKDGTTYAFGEPYYGNHSPSSTRDYMVAIAGTQDDGGYLLMNLSGQYYAAGDAPSVTNDPYVAPPAPLPTPAPAGSPPEQTLGSGNPATNNSPPCGGDPVNCEDGDLWETDTDVTVPGKGPHLDLARTYNSLDASTLGIFGYGWSDTYTMSLAVLPTVSAMVTEADGSTVTFYTSETGIFVAPEGTLATLVRKSTGGYSFCLRNTSTYTFNADGRLVAEQDLNGYTTTLTYQSVNHHQDSGSYQTGQLTSVTDPSGRSITFAYNATGLVSSVTNPVGGVTSYAYTQENLVSVTDPAGKVTRYSYDSKHRMVTETGPTGGVTTTTYGPGGQHSPDRGYTTGKVVRQEDPTGLVTKWTYTGNNAKSGTTTITGPHGSVTKETFTDGQMVTKTTGYGTPSAATWHYTYTATTFGQASVTDPAGHTKSTTYNATGDVTSTTDDEGHTTTTTYNQYNEPLVVTDPRGITTTYTYDAHGNVTKKVVTGAGGSPTATTTYAYWHTTEPGEVSMVWDPAGHGTSYTYDKYGDVTLTSTTTTGGQSSATQDVYNVMGEKVCQASPGAYHQGYRCPAGGTREPHATSWTYDADGEVVSETDPTTRTTATAYDVPTGTSPCTSAITGAAYCTVVTEPTGTVNVTYDDQDVRKVGTVDAYGMYNQITTTTTYDVAPGTSPCGTLATAVACVVTTNGNGQQTVTYYDVVTEAIKTASPGGKTTTATYNGTGEQVTSTTASGTTTDSYTNDGQLASVSYSDTAGGYTKPADVTYAYNADGQRTRMTDGTGTTTYTYDSLDRLTKTTDGAGKTVSYAYDLDGEVTSVTYPDGKTEAHTYNSAGQMTSTTDFQGRTTAFSYTLTAPGLPGGSQTTTQFPNGQSSVADYDALGQQVTASLTPSNPWSGTRSWLTYGTTARVSCTPAAHCMAVTDSEAIYSSTDPTSGGWRIVDAAVYETMTAASCPTTTLCVATDSQGGIQIGHGPTTWTESDRRYASVDPTEDLVAITCPTATFCAALDATGNVVTSTDPTGGASAWHVTSRPGGDRVSAISCVSSTLCVALTKGHILTSTDPTGGATAWTTLSVATATFSTRSTLATAVSCAPTGLCAVLDEKGDVLTSTDPTGGASAWTVAKVDTGRLSRVSCPSASFCVAAGTGGETFASTDPAGGPSAWKSFPGSAGASTLTCPSPALCIAGTGRTLRTGTGFTTWTPTRKTTSTYGTNGLLASQTTSTAGTTTSQSSYVYNPEDQLTGSQVSTTPEASGAFSYDSAGNPLEMVDPSNGVGLSQAFNATGEVTRSTPSAETPTTFTYDTIGDRVRATTGGSRTTDHYNQAAELTTVTSSATTQTYTYNGDGLRTSAVSHLKGLSSWQWLGTLTATGGTPGTLRGISCPSATLCVGVNTKDGVFAKDPTAQTAWAYQAVGTVSNFSGISCITTGECVATAGDGKIVSGSSSDLTGTWSEHTVDTGRQLTAVSCPDGTLCVATDATGNVVTAKYPTSSRWKVKAADPSGHLVGISCTQGGHCVAIDTSGNVVTSIDPSSSTSTWQVTKIDTTGRPVAVSCPSTTLCVMIDKTGTIFSSTDPTGGATTWHSTSLGSVSGLSALSCPTTTFCALTTTTGSTLATADPTGGATTWHVTDQTTAVTALSCVTASLCVGGTKHTTYTSRDTTTQQFTWDTEATTPELLSDGTDNFLYGPGGQVVEQEGMTSTGKPLYLVHDALGSTTVVTNSTRVESTYSYSPYGTVTKHTGPDTTPIGFAGAYTDLGTGLLYLVHRYYTPSTGQFLSVDPKVATTHEPYEYAGDDPVNYVDPTGDSTCGAGTSAGKVVDTYTMLKETRQSYRTATLYCGNTKYGFRHLETHVTQSGLLWPTFNYLIGLTLGAPQTIKYKSSNDTFTYSASETLVMTAGLVKWTATFVVVRAAYTAKIITAYAATVKWVTQTYPAATFYSDTSGYGCGGTVV